MVVEFTLEAWQRKSTRTRSNTSQNTTEPSNPNNPSNQDENYDQNTFEPRLKFSKNPRPALLICTSLNRKDERSTLPSLLILGFMFCVVRPVVLYGLINRIGRE